MKRPYSSATKEILNFNVTQKGLNYCTKHIDILDIMILDYIYSRALYIGDCDDEDALLVEKIDDKFYYELSDKEFSRYFPMATDFTVFWERVKKLCDEKLVISRQLFTGETLYRVSGLYEDIFMSGEQVC